MAVGRGARAYKDVLAACPTAKYAAVTLALRSTNVRNASRNSGNSAINQKLSGTTMVQSNLLHQITLTPLIAVAIAHELRCA